MMNVANVPCWEFLIQVFMFSFLRYVPRGECQSKIVIFLFLFYLVESGVGGERKYGLTCSANFTHKLWPEGPGPNTHCKKRERKRKGLIFPTKRDVMPTDVSSYLKLIFIPDLTFTYHCLSLPWPIRIFWPQIYALASCSQTKANKSPRNVHRKMCKEIHGLYLSLSIIKKFTNFKISVLNATNRFS